MRSTCRLAAGLLAAASFAALTSSCSRRIDLAAERTAIHTVDSLMVAAANARDLERWLSFLSDSASMLGPEAPPIVGKAAIRALVSQMMTAPGFSVIHRVSALEVSESADLAYERYAYELTAGGVTERGKDLTIFKKQPDGSWKLLFDSWSSDAPPAPAPKH